VPGSPAEPDDRRARLELRIPLAIFLVIIFGGLVLGTIAGLTHS
jgi:hypothetical protein